MKFSKRPSRSIKAICVVLPRAAARLERAFSLVELLVAMAVFSLMAALLLGLVSESSRLWQRAESQKARRQVARIIMETVKRDLEGVALPIGTTNTNSLNFVLNPAVAGINNRDSAFWQTRTSAQTGEMAEVGYFVKWHNGTPALCRYSVPATNSDSIFRSPANWLTTGKIDSYAGGLGSTNMDGLLAENVLGLWITMYDATNGILSNYNSRTATGRPSSVEVGVAIIDPRTAKRITSESQITSAYTGSADTFPDNLPTFLRAGVQVFKTRIELPAAP